MPDITSKGFKKPLQTDPYDLDIVNFNTDKSNELFEDQDLINQNIRQEMEGKADKGFVRNVDLNTITYTSLLGVIASANYPEMYTYGYLTTIRYSEQFISQSFKVVTPNQTLIYERQYYNETWDSWIKTNNKPITIGGSDNIRLIGEIKNWSTNKYFHLEAILHNIYLRDGSLLATAFLTVGKYSEKFANTEGKMQFLINNVGENVFKTKIQITDTGKIYTINDTYMGVAKWNILNKSDSVVIFNNPAIVTTIDGNVIWDSELNKTNMATNQDLGKKADKTKTYLSLTNITSTQTVLNKIITSIQAGIYKGTFYTATAHSADVTESGLIRYTCDISFTGDIHVELSGLNGKNYKRRIYSVTNVWIEPKWIEVATTDKVDIQLLNGWVVENGNNPIITKNGNHVSIVGAIKNGIHGLMFNIPIEYRQKSGYGFTQFADVLFSTGVKERVELLITYEGDVGFRTADDATRVANGSSYINFDIQYDI